MKKIFSVFVCGLAIALCMAGVAAFSACDSTEYKVSFSTSIGDSIEAVTVSAGEKVTEPAALSDGEHVLVGWFLGDKQWDFSKDKVTSAITLTAKWKEGCSENLHYTLYYDSYYSVTDYGNCTDLNITVPSEYKGYPVKEIANSAFSNCKHILSVYIPDTVDYVGSYTFEGCTSLKSVRMPKNYCQLSIYTYSGCTSLTYISYPSVNSVPIGYFYNCTSLASFEQLNGITSVGNYAFSGCSSLTSIDLSSVKTLGSNAFEGTGITEIVLDSNITSIGSDCFRNARYLTTAEINCSATTLGARCFFECVSLTAVSVNGKVKRIGERAFAYTALESLYLSSNIERIGANAFKACSALKSVTYGGTREAFKKINVGDGNEKLTSASIKYEG